MPLGNSDYLNENISTISYLKYWSLLMYSHDQRYQHFKRRNILSIVKFPVWEKDFNWLTRNDQAKQLATSRSNTAILLVRVSEWNLVENWSKHCFLFEIFPINNFFIWRSISVFVTNNLLKSRAMIVFSVCEWTCLIFTYLRHKLIQSRLFCRPTPAVRLSCLYASAYFGDSQLGGKFYPPRCACAFLCSQIVWKKNGLGVS
jgi:hypothetical protein